MSTPMFSIIIPTFNVAATLHACLDSIVKQSCSDFEVVIVDGASTDNTLDIANSYASTLGARLVIHSGPDQGIYDAMNHGVTMATGAWLLFLGADDTLYEADTLARVRDFIDAHQPSDLVYGEVIRLSSGSAFGGEFDLDRLLFGACMCHQSIFYRRELFAGIGPYNLRYPVCADWDFNIRCFSNPALAIRFMDIVVAHWNDVDGFGQQVVDKEFKKRLPKHFGLSALQVLGRIRMTLSQKEARQAAWTVVRRMPYVAYQARKAKSKSVRPS
ncbi:glycosyltransferase family 2 protein [Mycobacterium conspicuum]|uniref:PGL/p-HBAD biosynthesis glycosyltransferase n=1 Tax=Mycobacterium conspicuum TaxID=44010 RepID=A0A1X1SYR3_9MYCO|nr:glycosyltransferase family 2 protein [Mycobacterium conspicuum]ORV36750.1 glycosyltransferase [Mycobacterium conspicuum]BBZ39217.1 PGL/p-HBAD biosynthesis glycosyltransferase [Mycobacterium conspicuum]